MSYVPIELLSVIAGQMTVTPSVVEEPIVDSCFTHQAGSELRKLTYVRRVPPRGLYSL